MKSSRGKGMQESQNTRVVDCGGGGPTPGELGLTPAQERIYRCLAERLERFVTKSELINEALRTCHCPDSTVIAFHVCGIREKLRAIDAPFAIESKWGRGYRLVPISRHGTAGGSPIKR